MANQHVQVYILHLGSQQSISPDDLRVMWATACESMDVAVSRRPLGHGHQTSRPCFGLWAGRQFHRVPAEQRIRALLEARGFLFTLTHTAL
ncbi:MAG: hypothetical protein JNJ62_14300 [Pseudoxanthomonas mexicana]|uniref:hypothetical protein n=1 Tax=Pseudoxanthomonas mexicana TaxID=128785 RepID=UPI00078350CE|nr:hypothetical protein [Pseudoxanthomonas mexicana]MBL8257769.1 hypothetical protein [Pseudoxanthomonas mexicana]